VQVSWLGYPGSTGLAAIDYRFSDPYLETEESSGDSTERTILLPDSFWCYQPLEANVPVNSPPALANGFVTFGCLNNFCKINEPMLDLWAKLLKDVKDSRLLLLAHPGSHRQRTLHRFASQGIDPHRVEFFAPQPRLNYLKLYHRIDVGLDSFPYNGHTTSLDSLWMGVPVVTLVGQTPVSRAGWCQTSNLGLRELAARTPEQYLQIAASLARDPACLEELRRTLRARMERSPLMDAAKFAAGVEAAYRQMWKQWCGPKESK